VIVIFAEATQPPGTVVRVTVYVVVFVGEAATGFEVVELKPAAGVHKKVPVAIPPVAATVPPTFSIICIFGKPIVATSVGLLTAQAVADK
jgi:hypothetical protein